MVKASMDLAQQKPTARSNAFRPCPEVTVENYAQISDLQALREEGSRLISGSFRMTLRVIRQTLARQERGIDRF